MNKTPLNQSGFTTLIFLSLLLMLSLLGINAIMTSTTEVEIAGYEMNSTAALYAAEAGLEKASAVLTNQYNNYGKPPSSMPSDSFQIGKFAVSYEVTKPGVTVNKILTQGAYRGLYALSDEYVITARATAPGTKTQTSLQMTVDASVVPVYQFAVFYEEDLEIAPGPAMVLGGRVHSNANMYLQSNNSLRIDSYCTAAGDILHGRKPNSGQTDSYGTVEIKDGTGTYRNMKNADNTWLDASDADWVNESIGRWDGRVEDRNHGMTELKLPVVSSGEPKDMLERAGSDNVDSYEHKAGLKILDGQVFHRQPDSTWSNVTADFVSQGILTETTFYDDRENKDVSSYDIDIAKLNTSSYWPDGGIIYSSNTDGSNLTATRLKNGSELKEGLTVCSENPLYTVGNYNSVNKKPASLMADAYTVLSTAWSDGNSWGALSSRTASETRVNAAYMTGNKPTGGGTYSGGFENLPRFLENWSGKKFYWKGSAVDLWASDQAIGTWGGSYYSPPDRDWSFDLDFLDPSKLPPGTPLISIVIKTSWREITAPGLAAH